MSLESEAASEAASTTGKVLDMVQVGAHSTAVVVVTWALQAWQASDAESAEVEDVAPVPVAPEAVTSGVSQSNCVTHFEFARK